VRECASQRRLAEVCRVIGRAGEGEPVETSETAALNRVVEPGRVEQSFRQATRHLRRQVGRRQRHDELFDAVTLELLVVTAFRRRAEVENDLVCASSDVKVSKAKLVRPSLKH
jgi:hypothetical protein